jgi:DNA repair protein RadC
MLAKGLDKSFTIHDMPQAERPRERMQRHGAEALSTAELIAALIGSGTKGESVLMTAQKLMSHFGNLQNIAQASVSELSQVKGIGIARATQIKAAFELGRRLDDPDYYTKDAPVQSPEIGRASCRERV